MNIAVIDLGTNTFNLLIAEIKDNTFKTLHITKEFVYGAADKFLFVYSMSNLSTPIYS